MNLITVGVTLLAVIVHGQDIDNLETKLDVEYSSEHDWIDDPNVELPFTICKRSDPNLDECIKNSINQIIPSIGNGYAKLGIRPMDPYTVKRASFEYKHITYHGNLNIKNARTSGISRAQVKIVRSEVTDDSMKLEIDCYFPKLIMEGSYKGEGHFNSYLVKSKGYFNVTQRDIYITMVMNGQLSSRNNEQYMEIKQFDFQQPVIGNMKIYATGLYPDPVMNQVVLDFMNSYWPFVYQQLLPETKSSWEPIMINAINQVFNRVPFRRLMPID